ncbi:GTP-binding protein [uncultured Acetobacteroides sp.]|uniref:GTP-binding protein n=1 Tax=uncultured Acetobacteroides sp. TaxID=1760811 RepID=UPI0029F512BD|nr:GTP-binding protein [uncultured Acetobacteroides sp.]
MKLIVIAGPPTCGKTTVIRQVIRRIIGKGLKPAYLKIDVLFADEAELINKEFGIPTRRIYSGELCPDHCNVVVLDEAVEWAESEQADFLFVETAGLCLRCSPYVENSLGIVVLEATSGMNLPRKIGPMLTLADISVVTKIDLISQAEREVFRYRILEAAKEIMVVESNALYGIGIDPIVREILKTKDIEQPMFLKGNPPVGTCTICVGKKEIGAKNHFGVLRTMENDLFYVGE